MTRLRYFLTFAVLACFGLLAVLPLVGIHPADAARKLLTAAEPAPDVRAVSSGAVDIQALKDTDPELAKAAVYALANSLSSDEVGIMFEIVEADLHPEVQKAALYAVGNHETREVHEFLTRVAMTHEREELSKAAAYALGNSDEDTAVDGLILIAGSEAPTAVRKAAVYALGNTETERARKALINILKSN